MPTERAASNEGGFFVDFALAPEGRREEGGFAVYPNSLLFRAGDYPDKQFSMTPDEVQAMAAAWTPLLGNIEHKTFLRGRAGVIPKVWTEEGGAVLRGEVHLPLALDTLLTEGEKKVSLEFERAGKRGHAFALTTNPRVSDAALMSLEAEFARHDTPTGQQAIQDLHEHTVRLGAVCDPKNAQMSSEHEASAIQQVHNKLQQHGAVCQKIGQDTRPVYAMYNNEEAGNPRAGKGEKMSWIEKLLARLRGETVEFTAEDEQNVKDNLTRVQEKPVEFAAIPEFTAMQAEITRLKAERVVNLAEQWANGEITARRALPAERAALVAAFAQAAQDDAALPTTVTFAVGEETKTGSRVEALKATTAARQPHLLLTELLKDDPEGAQVLFNKATTEQKSNEGEVTPQRRAELLAQTTLGQTVLDAEKKNGKGQN